MCFESYELPVKTCLQTELSTHKMEDYEHDDDKPRNNPYTENDKKLLSQMKKIHKQKTEFNDDITFTFCPREMWGAVPPEKEPPMRQVKFPVQYVRFTDTGTDECYTPYECFRVLQHLQRDHMEKENLPDIKYNFMVGADGTIYEGRGWRNDADRPPDLQHLQCDCIDIAFIGNINDPSHSVMKNPFPKQKQEEHGFNWAAHGYDKHNYVKKRFRVVQQLLPNKFDPLYFM